MGNPVRAGSINRNYQKMTRADIINIQSVFWISVLSIYINLSVNSEIILSFFYKLAYFIFDCFSTSQLQQQQQLPLSSTTTTKQLLLAYC